MTTTIKIAPSILAADFARLGEQVAAAEQAGADLIHIDIMDGHFVPNLSMGPAVAAAVRKVTTLPLDIHLMVNQPEMFIQPFANAGANSINFHVEVARDAPHTIAEIRKLGMKPGIAIRPTTDTRKLSNLLPLVDIVLVMTVEPGFGGQVFLKDSPNRIARVRASLNAIKSSADITADGGVEPHTVPLAVKAGTTILVAGTSIFLSGGTIADSIQALREASQA